MNSLSVPRIKRESIIYFVISLWIHYLFRHFTMIWLSVSVFTKNSLWSHYLLRDFTRNSSSFQRNHNEFTINFANSPWMHFFHDFTLISLSYSHNHYEYTICFAKTIWIHYLLGDFTMMSLSVSRIHFKSIFFAKSLRIRYLFLDYLVNSLSISQIHRKSTIHYLFCVISLDSLSFSLIHYEIVISRINSEFIIYFIYLFRSIWICSLYSKSFTYYDPFLRNRQKHYVTDKNHYVIILS